MEQTPKADARLPTAPRTQRTGTPLRTPRTLTALTACLACLMLALPAVAQEGDSMDKEEDAMEDDAMMDKEDDDKGLPGPAIVAVLAVLGVAALVLRRGRA